MAWTLEGSLNPQSIQTANSVGMTAWTGDPCLFPSSLAPAVGVIYFIRAYVDNPQSSSHMYTAVKTAGSGLSGCYFGVYQAIAGGNRLGVTADISSSLTATGSVTVSLSAAVTGLTYNQELWLALLVSSGTSPTLVATRQYGSNIGMSSDYRVWKSTTGSQTSLPTTVPAITTPSLGYQFLGLGA
jgi:hypothetical protein